VLAAFPDWSAPGQIERLRRLKVETIAAESATALLWTPSPALPRALTVLFWWGFEYAASIVWIRSSTVGPFTRERHELLLVGTSGASPPRPPAPELPDSVHDLGNLDASARRRVIAQKLASWYPFASRVELFAPDPLPGWESAPPLHGG
jgi:N6-adenosine-specific RNA methylase IME4